MKFISICCFLIVAPFLLGAQGIQFEKGTVTQALQKAKQENKLLFIDAYAVWCGPCKKMDKTVFVDKAVGKYFNQHLVALKVDVEKGEGPDIKRKYGIEGLPGYVIIDGDDNVIARFSGSMSSQRFMEHIKKTVADAANTTSITSLAELYEKNKNSEQFVRSYLDKLKQTNSRGYVDVLEHYLSIQKSIPESSKEMVLLLADHSKEIIFGGKADEIIQRNQRSESWKLYVRKGIRQIYQNMPRNMLKTTTDYAIAKKDADILKIIFNRAPEAGLEISDAKRKMIYTDYYLKIGRGDKYKALVYDDNEALIKSIKVEKSRNYYLNWKKRIAAGDEKAKGIRPAATIQSRKIEKMVISYASFIDSDKDRKDLIRWMQVAYDLVPGDQKIMRTYAKVLYKFSDKKENAIEIMQQAVQIANKKSDKNAEIFENDLDLMKAGGEIYIK